MKKILRVLKSMVLAILGKPHLLIGVGVVSLGVLIWIGGPSVGIPSEEIRLLFIGLILFIWVLFLVYDRYRAKQSSQFLEAALQQQGLEQARRSHSSRKDEIEAIRAQFDKALQTLKKTKLGKGYRGSAALYALPWYMIIGPSASGKSTALRESGLHFPYLGENQKGVKGVGGTRNCDWWFTSEAVLLDTAGRYTTEDEDRDEWLGFLDLLKKTRQRKPLNGVLVAISIEDLIGATDQELEWHAKTIRDRIDEVMTRLGMVFPVYLIFTKCDLIDGFIQFFGDLNKTEREQIWGCTLKRRVQGDLPPQVQFEREFEQLLGTQYASRVRRLATAQGSEKQQIIGFPLQMASCETSLSRFIELVFHQNPYQDNPFFRGFYFTSGTQEGDPIDRILQSIGKSAGLQGIARDMALETEAKSYFIKNLFTEVIFPDQGLAIPSSHIFRQRGYVRVLAFGTAIVTVGAAMFFLASSYLGNKFLVRSVLDEAVHAAQIQGTPTFNPGHQDFQRNLILLDSIRERLDDIRRYEEEGVPLRLWGFYQGGSLYPPLQRLFHVKLESVLLQPTRHAMESQLSHFANTAGGREEVQNEGDYYSLLKAYLMIGDREHLDSVFLANQLKKVWSVITSNISIWSGTGVENPTLPLHRLLDFYSFHMTGKLFDEPEPNPLLVRNVRSILRRIPVSDRLYAQIIHDNTSQTVEAVSLARILEGTHQGTLMSEYRIPGVYTRAGFQSVFQPAMKKVLDDFGREKWVLGELEQGGATLATAVEEKYFGDYAEQWIRFLDSIHVRRPGTTSDVLALLEILSTPPSPISILLGTVKQETGLVANLRYQMEEGDTGFIQKMKQKLLFEEPKVGQPPAVMEYEDPVYREFHTLHWFMKENEGQPDKPSRLTQYVDELKQVHAMLQQALPETGASLDPVSVAQAVVNGKSNELSKAVTVVEQLSLGLDGEMRRVVQPFFLEPVKIALQTVIDRALVVVNQQWESEVYKRCQETVATRYPFQPSGEDAALTDISDLLQPQSGTWWAFYTQKLGPFIKDNQQNWELKEWRDVKLPLSSSTLSSLEYAKFFSESLFPSGQTTPGMAFDVFPYPDQGGSARSVSQIRLKVGDQDFNYANGPQDWQEMHWPGPAGSKGAMLQVNVKGRWEAWESKGWWGWFRLLDMGRVTAITDSQFQVNWAFTSRDNLPLRIQFDLKARSAKNPFSEDFFRKFSCIGNLTQT